LFQENITFGFNNYFMVVHLQTMLNQVCYRGSLERLDTEIRVIDKREPEVGYIRSEIREIREIKGEN